MDKKNLEILVCPLCKGRLHYDKSNQELICRFDKLAYKVKDGIPIMIAEKARNLVSQGEQEENVEN